MEDIKKYKENWELSKPVYPSILGISSCGKCIKQTQRDFVFFSSSKKVLCFIKKSSTLIWNLKLVNSLRGKCFGKEPHFPRQLFQISYKYLERAKAILIKKCTKIFIY